jgi:hypothetical protein
MLRLYARILGNAIYSASLHLFFEHVSNSNDNRYNIKPYSRFSHFFRLGLDNCDDKENAKSQSSLNLP